MYKEDGFTLVVIYYTHVTHVIQVIYMDVSVSQISDLLLLH
jgi:hypothetical protein